MMLDQALKEDLIACLPDLLDKALPVESQASV